MAFTTTTPAAPEEAVWLGSHPMPRTMQSAPLLRSAEGVSEGTYTSNRQKRSTCAIGNEVILKDNSKTHIIPNPLKNAHHQIASFAPKCCYF